MRAVALLWLLCGIPCGGAAGLRPQQPRQPAFHNRFIVKWRLSTPAADAVGFAAHVNAASSRTGVRMLSLRHDAYSWQSVVQLAGYTPQTLPAERAALLRAVAADPAVAYIVEDRILYPSLAPNDKFYHYQWHYGPVVSGGVNPSGLTYGINLPDAWAHTTGAANPVAVVDTGITKHPDLNAKVIQGYDMISPDSPGNFTTANDGNGRDPDPSDPGDWTSTEPSSWHGTHVSGTIGAVTNNSIGVAGVSWGAKILPVRALGVGGGYNSDINDAVRWAAGLAVDGVPANANPARVINLSLGGDGPCDEPTQEAINASVNAGAIIVVAAGNANSDATNTNPCNCPQVICVAAHGPSGQRAGYSNFGAAVAITAPGGDYDIGRRYFSMVLSTLNNGTTVPGSPVYGFDEGTSMATPHVSGLVALMLSLNAHLTWEPVKTILRLTARPFPPPNLAPHNCSVATCGGGLADAAAALAFVAAMPANDQCEAAIAVACGQTVQGSVQNATALSADPQCGGTTQTTADVWYSLQVSSVTPLQVFTYTSNANFDTQINVYNANCSNLQCVAGNDNATAGEAGSYLAFAAASGSWLIRVSGAAQARGAFALTVVCPGSGLVGGGAAPSPSPSPSPSPMVPSSPSPGNQNSFETATNPSTPIAAFGGTPVAGQGVAMAIDGTTTAYSNQGGPGSGFSVTLPDPVALTALRIYTSNENAAQDPSSYELYGSNDNSVLVLIASGNIRLPAARNPPGLQVTTALNFLLVRFSNTQAYANYLVVFPTLAGSSTSRAGTSTMSVSEVQLLRDSNSSNNDNSGLLGLLALLVLPVIIIAAVAWYVLTHRASPAARAEEWTAPVPFSAADPNWYPPAVPAPLPMPTPTGTHLYGSRSDPYSWSTPVNPTTPQFAFSAPPPAPWPADTEVRW